MRRSSRPSTEERLASAVRGLLRRTTRPSTPRPASGDPVARLDALERDVREVRTRVNALFFAVLSVTLGEVIGRAVLS